MNPTTHIKIAFDFYKSRRHGLHEIIQNFIGNILVERPFVTVTPKIKFQTFQFNAKFVGNINDPYDREVGLAGARAKAGEFGAFETDFIVPFGIRIRENLKIF